MRIIPILCLLEVVYVMLVLFSPARGAFPAMSDAAVSTRHTTAQHIPPALFFRCLEFSDFASRDISFEPVIFAPSEKQHICNADIHAQYFVLVQGGIACILLK